ncbi:MAG: MBL fold metallo-hydrolase [Clostridia bacterium]|nr:MBL fold metallo-hydrolase [Clostridia bacterium]
MKTVIHQLKTTGVPLDGMCYVIQCEDSSTVVIDGGMDNGDAELLLDFLKKLSGSDKPVIDAWFLTHAHPDHTYACMGMGARHAEEVTVKKIVYEFPSMEFRTKRDPGTVYEIDLFEKSIKNFKGAEIITPRTGDVFKFGQTKFEVLFTYSDLPPLDEIPAVGTNDTSTVLRLSAEGQTVLFLGDVERTADKVIIARHGAALKSDVCQIAHHGSVHSSSKEFYDLVDPEFLLWPVGEESFYKQLRTVGVDRHIISKGHLKDIFVAGQGTVSLEMPIRARKKPCLPALPDVPSKPLTASLAIPKCDRAPELDACDPLWASEPLVGGLTLVEKREEVFFDPKFALLWHDNKLFMRLVFDKPSLSDPVNFSSLRSDCVRLLLCEKAVNDPFALWVEHENDPAFVPNMKMYPELKNIRGTLQNNTDPERCSCRSILTDKGFEIFASYGFVLPHESGDLISMDLEFSYLTEKNARRAACYSFTDAENGISYVGSPYLLRYFRLG